MRLGQEWKNKVYLNSKQGLHACYKTACLANSKIIRQCAFLKGIQAATMVKTITFSSGVKTLTNQPVNKLTKQNAIGWVGLKCNNELSLWVVLSFLYFKTAGLIVIGSYSWLITPLVTHILLLLFSCFVKSKCDSEFKNIHPHKLFVSLLYTSVQN